MRGVGVTVKTSLVFDRILFFFRHHGGGRTALSPNTVQLLERYLEFVFWCAVQVVWLVSARLLILTCHHHRPAFIRLLYFCNHNHHEPAHQHGHPSSQQQKQGPTIQTSLRSSRSSILASSPLLLLTPSRQPALLALLPQPVHFTYLPSLLSLASYRTQSSDR